MKTFIAYCFGFLGFLMQGGVELELSPLNGHIMFLLKEMKDDSKL